jgi:hypothetical protein
MRSGADQPLRDSFTRRELSHHLILTPFGGLVMAGPCLRTKNPFARSSQSKFLGGVGAIPNYPCGKKQSSTDVHNAGARRRHQNTLPDVLTLVAFCNYKVQLRP